jgi:hypothetical protein
MFDPELRSSGELMETSKKSYHEDYVPVAFVHDQKEAEFYQALLEDHDIPAIIEEETDVNFDALDADIPILVPREQQEDAELIIERRSTSDDEFDMGIVDSHQHDDEEIHEIDNEIIIPPDFEEL